MTLKLILLISISNPNQIRQMSLTITSLPGNTGVVKMLDARLTECTKKVFDLNRQLLNLRFNGGYDDPTYASYQTALREELAKYNNTASQILEYLTSIE